jgi:O-antigen chain-terminating methyltransferase
MEKFDSFYLKFEETFRGSEKEIKERLKFYIPILKVYPDFFKKGELKAVDLGCGRGEFLEIFKEMGYEPIGVEINPFIAEKVRMKNFKVVEKDIVEFLRTCEDRSFHIVSLIHVIEHLDFEYMFHLFKEVYRVLCEGGSFILETPYVKNILVGLYDFWSDPTHKRPIHVEFIKFMGKYFGFDIIKHFPLQGAKKKVSRESNFTDILSSSRDVSIVFIKPARDENFTGLINNALSEMENNSSVELEDILTGLNGVFESLHKTLDEQRKTLHDFAKTLDEQRKEQEKFDRNLNDFAKTLDEFGNNLEAQKINQEKIITEIQKVESLIALLSRSLEEMKNEFQIYKTNLNALWYSKPWRFYQFLGKIKKGLYNFPKRMIKRLAEEIKKRYRLYGVVMGFLNKHPALKYFLKKWIYSDIPNTPTSSVEPGKLINREAEIIYKRLRRVINE